MQRLGQAQNIIVYTQDTNILETICYHAEYSICTTFEQGKMISMRSITNYYENDNAVLATLIKNNIDHNNQPSHHQTRNSTLYFDGRYR